MKRQLIFLHIEKTAGTSLINSVITPNLPGCKRVTGRQILKERDARVLHGHVDYGYPRLVRRPVDYATMLREPTDRSISFYYYVRSKVRLDLVERHRLRDYAHSVTLAGFFENPRLSNAQTRRIAGFEFGRSYLQLHRSKLFRSRMLSAAKRHLEDMPVFGLQEEYQTSQQRFLDFVGGEVIVDPGRQKYTSGRMTVEEIADFRPQILERLAVANELDYEFHSFATDLFKARA